jgi:uncharacterized UPF0146 family protein
MSRNEKVQNIKKVYNFLLEKKEQLTEREFEKIYAEDFKKIEKLYDAVCEGKGKSKGGRSSSETNPKTKQLRMQKDKIQEEINRLEEQFDRIPRTKSSSGGKAPAKYSPESKKLADKLSERINQLEDKIDKLNEQIKAIKEDIDSDDISEGKGNLTLYELRLKLNKIDSEIERIKKSGKAPKTLAKLKEDKKRIEEKITKIKRSTFYFKKSFHR